jgi:hypothetical protein
MKIWVHLYSQAQAVEIDGARNAYQKGDLYCVLMPDGTAYKFPLQHIFRVKEQDDNASSASLGPK